MFINDFDRLTYPSEWSLVLPLPVLAKKQQLNLEELTASESSVSSY